MNCTTGTTAISGKTIRRRKMAKSNGTSGCSYITNVNLYLHPNSNISGVSEEESEVPKIKTRCNNSGCFYYDCDLLGDEFYYCCNPLCSCFSPDWYL